MSSSQNFVAELVATARAIAADGKGILAADESTGTIGKRFAGINVEIHIISITCGIPSVSSLAERNFNNFFFSIMISSLPRYYHA